MPRRQPSPLRAVKPGERAAKARAKRQTVTSAATDGSTRDMLVAMRDRIARAVDDPNCPSRDLAALTRRLHEIVKDIAGIDAQAEEEHGPANTPDADFDASAI